MHLVTITPPATLPITLDEARNQLRLEVGESSPDNARITALVGAATKVVESKLKQTLVSTVLDLYLDSFSNPVRILPGPVISVTSVKYLNPDGVLTTLPTDQYRVSTGKIGWVEPTDSFPSTKSCKDCVVVRYTAGYSAIPDNIKSAILLILDALYNQNEIDLAVDLLLSGERVVALP